MADVNDSDTDSDWSDTDDDGSGTDEDGSGTGSGSDDSGSDDSGSDSSGSDSDSDGSDSGSDDSGTDEDDSGSGSDDSDTGSGGSDSDSGGSDSSSDESGSGSDDSGSDSSGSGSGSDDSGSDSSGSDSGSDSSGSGSGSDDSGSDSGGSGSGSDDSGSDSGGSGSSSDDSGSDSGSSDSDSDGSGSDSGGTGTGSSGTSTDSSDGSSSSVTYSKATFAKLTSSGSPSTDPSDQVVCDFNPETFDITQSVRWDKRPRIGQNVPDLTFIGGDGRELEVRDLLFDSTDDGSDVRNKYALLLTLASVDTTQENQTTGKSQPDGVMFQWGSFLAFSAVVKKVTQKFLLFKQDGTPLRARISVTLAELPPAPQTTNPTSRSMPRKTHIVHEAETLDYIAYEEYGDPAQWHHIAVANDLPDPKKLIPGQVLRLPPLK